MSTFNNNFYEPNFSYTRKDAEKRLLDLGYKNFHFKSSSYSNGSSFYFESEDGKEIRVSDHRLTGRRAFNTIDISISSKPVRTLSEVISSEKLKEKREKEALEIRERLAKAIAEKQKHKS